MGCILRPDRTDLETATAPPKWLRVCFINVNDAWTMACGGLVYGYT